MTAIRYVIAKSDPTAARDTYQLTVTVTAAHGVDREIFAYVTNYGGPGETIAQFSHVCSPSDLAEYPRNAPNSTRIPEFYRRSRVELYVRSAAELAMLIEDIQADIQCLTTTLDTLPAVRPLIGTHVAGVFPEPADDSSSSSSSSSAALPDDGTPTFATRTATYVRSVSEAYSIEWSPTHLIDTGTSGSVAVALAGDNPAKTLMAQGLGFTLPPDAPVHGFEIAVRCRSTATGARLAVVGVFNPDSGKLSPTVLTANVPTGDYATVTFGGEYNMFGLSRMATDVCNRGDFGAVLVIDANQPATVTVEAVQLTVFYNA